MAYSVKTSKRLRPSAADTETKALLYLMNFREDSGGFLETNIQELPVINKDNVLRIVDPELLVQVFFVGQDKKVTYDIVNRSWYKTEDFYKLIYSMGGIVGDNISVNDVEKVKKQIKELKDERSILLKGNKVLKKSNAVFEYLSSTNDRAALENMLKEAEVIKNKF